jgi:glucosyl-3-phosphoglycerate synthase
MSGPAAQSPPGTRSERGNPRLFHHSIYSARRVAQARERRGLSVSVCLPARECASTVGEIVQQLAQLRDAGALDEIVVVDAASEDGTAALAARAGARVHQEAELMPAYGPVLGKGDAMWRALSVLGGDLICFLDADTEGFSPHFLTGLLGPLLCEPGVSFVKGYYRRPFTAGQLSLADGGGRVNHLVARPALALFYPPLAAVRQPLAGEVAASRALLERLPFTTGYGVEIGMLIDAWRAVGLDGIAQVDLEEHRNRNQPLSALTPMALVVLGTIAARLEREGRLTGVASAAASNGRPGGAGAPVERPPRAGAGVA